MPDDNKVNSLEKALRVLSAQKIAPPTGGTVIDIQSRAQITLILKALQDISRSL